MPLLIIVFVGISLLNFISAFISLHSGAENAMMHHLLQMLVGIVSLQLAFNIYKYKQHKKILILTRNIPGSTQSPSSNDDSAIP